MLIMISQPMNGLTNDEILSKRNKVTSILISEGYQVVETFFENFNMDDKVINKSLYYLSKSLECMSCCDAVYFCDGWENARGCKIEHDAATQYGLTIFYEN